MDATLVSSQSVSTPSSDGFDPIANGATLASGIHRHPQVQSQPDNSNESWLGKAWDWSGKPILPIDTTGDAGVQKGLEEFWNGTGTPRNIAIGAAIAASDGALAPLLGSLGVSAEAIPTAVAGTRALISAGFTGQQVYGLIQQSPELVNALRTGDTDKAKEIGTEMVLGGSSPSSGRRMQQAILHRKGSKLCRPGACPVPVVQKALLDRKQVLQTTALELDKLAKDSIKLVPNKFSRQGVYDNIEAKGDIGTLGGE